MQYELLMQVVGSIHERQQELKDEERQYRSIYWIFVNHNFIVCYCKLMS
jgi:hypothetical protein